MGQDGKITGPPEVCDQKFEVRSVITAKCLLKPTISDSYGKEMGRAGIMD